MLSGEKSLNAGSIYRHPNADLVEFEACFCLSIEQQHALQKTVIFGDFNIDHNKIKAMRKLINIQITLIVWV